MTPLRWSNLKWMRMSPRHYFHYALHPVAETSAMRVGGRVHHLVLGGDRTFAVYPGTRRGKEWEAFRSQHLFDTILNSKEEQLACAISEAVCADEECNPFLVSSIMEKRVEWQVAGRDCIGTPDIISGDWLLDLKVTSTAKPERFQWHALRQGWVAQLAWYWHGLKQDMGDTAPTRLGIIAVEATPPHVVQSFELTERAIELGTRTWRDCFELLRVCEDSDEWPGYVTGMVPLDAPEEDVELDFGTEADPEE